MCGNVRLRGLGIAALLTILFPAALTAQELEPNDPCAFAQAESAAFLPVSISGSLDSTASFADVDFFRFSGNPGDAIQVDLEGASTGSGTLSDPYLGWFDADCVLQQTNDDGGFGVNSQLTLVVPPEGEFVLAVSQCCDSEFQGGGQGSYLLNLGLVTTAGSIFGTLEDAESNAPLPGDAPPFAYVNLFRCNFFDCWEFMAFASADGSGGFGFTTKYDGSPLPTGTYQVQVYAQGYQSLTSAPFEVATDQHVDLGVLHLEPVPLIGSVAVRLVDALDGMPLIGNASPFAAAILARCEEFGCYGVAYAQADETGGIRFEGPVYQIQAGDFVVIGQADGYHPTESDRFSIGRNEHVDLGDLELRPVPIRFGDMQTCELAEGQVCRFGIDISVRITKRLRAEAWSIVQFFPISEPGPTSQFQVGRLGVKNPMPQPLNLKKGETRTLMFEFGIPDNVPDSFLVCTSVFIGRTPNPQFDLLAERPLFCAFKQAGELNLLSEKESRKVLRRYQNQ